MEEVLSKRSENSKTYHLGGNKYRTEICAGAVHYKDNYADLTEQWKDIDLTWVGNRIDKAPYELTLEGNKITVRDKRTGNISSIELLKIGNASIPPQAWEKSKGLARAFDTDLEIVAGVDRVSFTRILKSDAAPRQAKYKVTGKIPLRVSARDQDIMAGVLPVEWTLVDGILTEELKPNRPVRYPVRIDPTLTIQPSAKDNFIDEYAPTTNYGSDAALRTGAYTGYRNRPILELSLANLPANATLTSATFSLYYYDWYNYDPVGLTIWAYKLTRTNWVELESTWNIYKTGFNWTTAGGDYVTTSPDGGSTTYPASFGWVNWNVLAIVQDAFSASVAVELLVKDAVEGTGGAQNYYGYFYSNNYTTALTLRPKLVIEYAFTKSLSGTLNLSGTLSKRSPASLTLRPNATGYSSQLNRTPEAGVQSWQNVDDVTPDEATTTVWANPDFGPLDLYNLEDSQLSGVIFSVAVVMRCNKSGAGPTGKTAIRTVATNYFGAEVTLTDTWTDYSTLYTTNPNTGLAWTWTQINALEAGIYMVASTAGTYAYCTQVYVTVNYILSKLLSGSLTSSGALEVKVSKALAGVLTSVGTLGIKVMKALSGSLGLSGAVSSILKHFKSLAGTLNLSGTLTTILRFFKTLAGTLSSSGALNIKVMKALDGALGLSGSISSIYRQFKSLAGTLNMSGALTGILTIFKSLAGTLNSAGTLIKLPKIGLTGVLTSAGTLGRKVSIALSGTLTSSGVLTSIYRQFKSLAGTLNMSGALTNIYRQVKSLAGSLGLSGELNLKIMKALAGTLNSSGSLTSIYKQVKSLAGVLTSTGALNIKVKKALAGTLTFTGSLGVKIKKALAGVLNLAGALTKLYTSREEITMTLLTEPCLDMALITESCLNMTLTVEGGGKI